ncbi:MAG: aminoacyl-tRNA hydrolase, partial [bacterium]|nr:aminoacyl-tRNA hydrolase [bacterium]
DLAWGRLRFDTKAGSAGQRGVQSVIDLTGSKEFDRLRVGIGRPESPKGDPVDYVLNPFSSEQKKELAGLKTQAFEALNLYLTEGFEKAQQRFH